MDVAGAQARTIPLLLRHPAASPRGSASVSFSCGGARRSWAASATAEGEDGGRGYEQVAMDTPGAYRLVDRSTGRSVIVWGGVDEGDEPSVPSPDVLSRSARGDRPASKGAAKGASAGVGSFGRLKAQKVQALARRSSAQLKSGATSSTRATTPPRSEYFDDSDEDENSSGRRKYSSDPARRAKPNSNYRDERTRSAPSLNSVLRQYKGDDDDWEFRGEEPTGERIGGRSYLWIVDSSVAVLLRRLAAAMRF